MNLSNGQRNNHRATGSGQRATGNGHDTSLND